MKQLHRNVHNLEVLTSASNPFSVLQVSDIHIDSIKCDRKLFKKHLKEAEEREALVFINGDLLAVMGCARDPRSSYSDIRPEYLVTNYLDAVIEDVIEMLSKYKVEYFIGHGNHETNIFQRMHTDVTKRVVEGLKGKGLAATMGGYSGWMIYTLRRNINGGRIPLKQFYHHGYGGNAPRSKGILKVDINMKNHPDANIITTGHDHNNWYLPVTVQRLNKQFKVHNSVVHNIDTGSYKKLGDGFAGWATEKGFANPTLGGWWTELCINREKIKGKETNTAIVKVSKA